MIDQLITRPEARIAKLQRKAVLKRRQAAGAKAYTGWGRSIIRDAGRRFARQAKKLEAKASRIARRHGLA